MRSAVTALRSPPPPRRLRCTAPSLWATSPVRTSPTQTAPAAAGEAGESASASRAAWPTPTWRSTWRCWRSVTTKKPWTASPSFPTSASRPRTPDRPRCATRAGRTASCHVTWGRPPPTRCSSPPSTRMLTASTSTSQTQWRPTGRTACGRLRRAVATTRKSSCWTRPTGGRPAARGTEEGSLKRATKVGEED